MNKLQEKQLFIYHTLESICLKNDIPIFLAYGSALGAIRHNGFIPWDDDLDVFIFADDRDRLMDLCKSKLPSNFFYQTQQTDKEYALAIDRIRLSSSTLIELSDVDRDINHGIFIDIYPLYKCSDSIFFYYYQYLIAFYFRSILLGNARKNSAYYKKLIQLLIRNLTPNWLKEKIINSRVNYINSFGGSKYLSTFYGDEAGIKYPAIWFSESKNILFETFKAPVAIRAEKCLKKDYGNYMEYPPKDKQTPHHDYEFLDLENSYLEYKGVRYLKE